MKAFAKTLAELHLAATEASIQEFPAEAIRLVQQWIAFDGAVLGMGRVDADLPSALDIAEAHVHGRDAAILDEYAPVSADDPITRAFLGGLASPLRNTCDSLYAQRRLDPLHAFARRHDLRQLMLFGNAPSQTAPARWLVLYRGAGSPFSADDAEYLDALWLHLSIAISVNRARALERIAADEAAPAPRALALVNMKGMLLAADPLFGVLLRQEWPGFQGGWLPPPAVDSFLHNHCYHGQAIDILFALRGGHIACSATPASAYASLSPAENRVARLFSDGMSQKEVARALGVSEHTVRAQLKSSYAKLGVHDKAALTRYVVSHAWT